MEVLVSVVLDTRITTKGIVVENVNTMTLMAVESSSMGSVGARPAPQP